MLAKFAFMSHKFQKNLYCRKAFQLFDAFFSFYKNKAEYNNRNQSKIDVSKSR